MQTGLSHIQFKVQPANLKYYAELFGFLGWHEIMQDDTIFAASGRNGEAFWFIGEARDVVNDYDGPGVNHVAIGAESIADVDAAAEFLTEKGVEMLFETPRHRPDFSDDESSTYYQIMFKTPDAFLLEFVYTGPK